VGKFNTHGGLLDLTAFDRLEMIATNHQDVADPEPQQPQWGRHGKLTSLLVIQLAIRSKVRKNVACHGK
jgi:hypothetical protein